MPDDNKQQDFHTFDKEPATGSLQNDDSTEHADLNHRLEADSNDEPSVASKPAFQPVVERPAVPQPVPVEQPSTSASEATLPNPGPGLMVLQWLVYALWGWTVLALSGLVILIVSQLLNKEESGYDYGYGDGISYLLAAVIVLFIISLVCDLFYAKAERRHAKTTGSNVIMIIHAVLFSLFGIGALISSVFGGVQLMIGDTNDTSSAVSTIISGAIIFILYGLTLLRTLRPLWLKGVVRIYWLLMATAIVISVILGVMGPAAQARLRAQDQIIETELPVLARAINEHTQSTGSLPKSLDEITVFSGSGSDGFETITSKNLVEYKPGEKLPSTMRTMDISQLDMDQRGGTVEAIYHYQLCVEYKTSYGDDDSYSSEPRRMDDQRYDTSVDTYSHGVGKKCYDVQTDYSY